MNKFVNDQNLERQIIQFFFCLSSITQVTCAFSVQVCVFDMYSRDTQKEGCEILYLLSFCVVQEGSCLVFLIVYVLKAIALTPG